MIRNEYTVFAPSGSEQKMIEFVKEKLSAKFEKIRVDALGNLICSSGDGGLCIECGMDTCGIMMVEIDKHKSRFAGAGGINAEYLIDKKIEFKDGNFGFARYDGDDASKSKICDLYLEGDSEPLKIGDFGVVASEFSEDSNKIYGNSIGNRVGLSVVSQALEACGKIENLTVIFSAQKRTKARGIQAFFAANEFDRVITIDGAECSGAIKTGKGSFLVVADKIGTAPKEFVDEISKKADKNGVRLEKAVVGQDFCIGTIATLGKGTACVAIAVPVNNKNKTIESIEKSDIDECVKLLKILID
ncbi:MAG: hypothetical protein IJE62_04005 [Clostridia bacterium]|nr:hypothetical protein [Clostridia bacterium]